MLLQTNSYIVPAEKREEHARIIRRFRQVLARLGCESFEVYEQVGPNFAPFKGSARFVQLMRFRDRQQQQSVQAAERDDDVAQDLVREFCELVNLDFQKNHSLFAVGFYSELDGSGRGSEQIEAVAERPTGDFTTADSDPAAQEEAARNLENLPKTADDAPPGPPASPGESPIP